MRFSREFAVTVLLLADMGSYRGHCFPETSAEKLHISHRSTTQEQPWRDDKMMAPGQNVNGSVTRPGTEHFTPDPEKTEKKGGSFLIQEYLISFLPFCPNGYQITVEPDVSMPKHVIEKHRTGVFSSKPNKYVLCQENGMAKIKVQSPEETERTKNENLDMTYWITKAEAMTPLYESDRSVLNDLVAEVEQRESSKALTDAYCLPRPCPLNQLMAINTKNLMDCRSFYICIMGHHFLLHCPAGHLFSEEYGVCVERQYSDCQVREDCKFVEGVKVGLSTPNVLSPLQQ